MNEQIRRQEIYWDSAVGVFDAIYSHDEMSWNKFLDSVFRWDMYERYKFTLRKAEPIENRTFLDVGCGTGRYSIELARRRARRIVGIDIAQNMIAVCQQRAEAEGVKERTSFLKTDLFGLESNETYDVCIGIGLFDYVQDAHSLLRKMRERANHSVIMSFPQLWSWRALARKIRLSLKGCDVYFYTRRDVEELVRGAGFKEHEVEKIGQLFCVVAYV